MTDLFDPKHDRATACTDAARMLLPLLGGHPMRDPRARRRALELWIGVEKGPR